VLILYTDFTVVQLFSFDQGSDRLIALGNSQDTF